MVKKIGFAMVLLAAAGLLVIGSAQASGLPSGTSDRVAASVKSLAEAGLPNELSTEITRVMLENQFDDGQVMAVHRMLMETMEHGLPAAPLTGKILEGISKKVQPARIVMAVENLHARQVFALSQAKQITGSASSAGDLAGVYTASLSAGLTPEDAKAITAQLVQATDGQKATGAYDLSLATMITVRDMSRLGVNSDTLTKTITSALNMGFTTDRMEDLHRAFIAGAKQTNPETLAISYGDAIARGTGIGAGVTGGQTGSGSTGQGGASGIGSASGNAGGNGASGTNGGSAGNGSGSGQGSGSGTGGNSGTGTGPGPGSSNGEAGNGQ